MANTLENSIKNKVETGQPIKLHLGCGPVILENYINIDGEYAANIPGVVVYDITQQLPIPDNSVEEILTVHVIEHLAPNEVSKTLKEWHRILKPGGSVATEWPDLLKACKFLVEDPSRIYSDNKKVKKMGVAGIYGNIAKHKDPIMLHKWGYSAEAMCKLYQDNGYTRTEIQENQYRKSGIDSRVVAFK